MQGLRECVLVDDLITMIVQQMCPCDAGAGGLDAGRVVQRLQQVERRSCPAANVGASEAVVTKKIRSKKIAEIFGAGRADEKAVINNDCHDGTGRIILHNDCPPPGY